MLESLGFAVVYIVSSVIYFTLWTMAIIGVPPRPFIVLLAGFAAVAIPFEMLLWYFAASRWRRLSTLRIIAVGLAAVVIPCLLAILITLVFGSGYGIFGTILYLPAALPLGVLLTWVFTRFRERGAEAAPAETERRG